MRRRQPNSMERAVRRRTIAALRGLIDRVRIGEVRMKSFHSHRPVMEVDPADGWKRWKPTGDVYLTLHFIERKK